MDRRSSLLLILLLSGDKGLHVVTMVAMKSVFGLCAVSCFVLFNAIDTDRLWASRTGKWVTQINRHYQQKLHTRFQRLHLEEEHKILH